MQPPFLAPVLVVITLISGCAVKGNVTVTESTEGARARIRVAALDAGSIGAYRGVRAFPDSQCTARDIPGSGNVVNPMMGFEKTLNDQSRGMPSTVISQDSGLRKAEFYARAGKPIAFTYVRTPTQSLSVFGGVQTTCQTK